LNNSQKEKKFQKITGGQAVVRSLKAEKVEHIFGLIGSATIEVFDALYEEKKILFDKELNSTRNMIRKTMFRGDQKSNAMKEFTYIIKQSSEFVKQNNSEFYFILLPNIEMYYDSKNKIY